MKHFSMTGGARIGMANATWPFATLNVSGERLEINTSLIGNLVFGKDDIISIEPYNLIPVMGQGIRINHRVPGYKSKVIFWTMKNPYEVIRQITETGFLDGESVKEQKVTERITHERETHSGQPLRIPFIIIMVALWNLLFITDFLKFYLDDKETLPLGYGAISAVAIFFVVSVLTLVSKKFRGLVLKKGRELRSIRTALFFFIFLSGFMLMALSMIFIFQR